MTRTPDGASVKPLLSLLILLTSFAAVNGLNGFPEAIESVFPKNGAALCIVHLVGH